MVGKGKYVVLSKARLVYDNLLPMTIPMFDDFKEYAGKYNDLLDLYGDRVDGGVRISDAYVDVFNIALGDLRRSYSRSYIRRREQVESVLN